MGGRQKQSPLPAYKADNRRLPAACFILLAAIFLPSAVQAKLTSLGQPPPWEHLEPFQETITEARFLHLLNEIYAPRSAYEPWIRIEGREAHIRLKAEEDEEFILRFAESQDSALPPPRYWKPRQELPPPKEGKPLSGIRIALDPGHIGGSYGPMEERSFPFDDGPPIQEGDLTLEVARYLQKRLDDLGAEVWLSRSEAKPLTLETIEGLMPVAYQKITGKNYNKENYNASIHTPEIRKLNELLFYRVSEIRARAEKVNGQIKPDLVLAVHFNAASWPDHDKDNFPLENHFHLLVNGAYSSKELSYDDIRFEMLLKLLTGTAEEEIALGEAIIPAMVKANELPAFIYSTPNAAKVGTSPYLWARNLLANRLYRCPVVYLEPYVLNNRDVAMRARMGDYEGYLEVEGALRKSLIREYADGVVDGLLAYYGSR